MTTVIRPFKPSAKTSKISTEPTEDAKFSCSFDNMDQNAIILSKWLMPDNIQPLKGLLRTMVDEAKGDDIRSQNVSELIKKFQNEQKNPEGVVSTAVQWKFYDEMMSQEESSVSLYPIVAAIQASISKATSKKEISSLEKRKKNLVDALAVYKISMQREGFFLDLNKAEDVEKIKKTKFLTVFLEGKAPQRGTIHAVVNLWNLMHSHQMNEEDARNAFLNNDKLLLPPQVCLKFLTFGEPDLTNKTLKLPSLEALMISVRKSYIIAKNRLARMVSSNSLALEVVKGKRERPDKASESKTSEKKEVKRTKLTETKKVESKKAKEPKKNPAETKTKAAKGDARKSKSDSKPKPTIKRPASSDISDHAIVVAKHRKLVQEEESSEDEQATVSVKSKSKSVINTSNPYKPSGVQKTKLAEKPKPTRAKPLAIKPALATTKDTSFSFEASTEVKDMTTNITRSLLKFSLTEVDFLLGPYGEQIISQSRAEAAARQNEQWKEQGITPETLRQNFIGSQIKSKPVLSPMVVEVNTKAVAKEQEQAIPIESLLSVPISENFENGQPANQEFAVDPVEDFTNSKVDSVPIEPLIPAAYVENLEIDQTVNEEFVNDRSEAELVPVELVSIIENPDNAEDDFIAGELTNSPRSMEETKMPKIPSQTERFLPEKSSPENLEDEKIESKDIDIQAVIKVHDELNIDGDYDDDDYVADQESHFR